MQEQTENKLELKNWFNNFYHQYKFKIYILLIFFYFLIAVFLYQQKNEKKNILVAEKYIQAGIYLTSKENEKAKKIYEEIILSKNKFYSILALNTILEKNLISDKNNYKLFFYYRKICKKYRPKRSYNFKKSSILFETL